MQTRQRHTRPDTKRTTRRDLGAAIVALVVVLFQAAAFAQQVSVVVNGEPITSYDIEQRSRFLQLTTHKTPPRQEVVDELINDKLKVQTAKHYKLDITNADVDFAFANMGKRMGLSGEKLTAALAQNGVDSATLKARIRAEIAWTQIVRGKFASSLQIGEKEIREALQSRSTSEGKDNKDGKDVIQGSVENKDDSATAKGVEYTMRPILFIVPRGSSESSVAERKREAEGLRARFESCETGLEVARSMRYVAVRDQVVKSSADLVPELRKILDNTPLGHLTSPEVTEQGVQVFAVCSKKEVAGDTPEQRQVRDKIFAQRFETQSKRYLAELRRGAMIEVK
jgi:peptidyl-prolyl cis-trans isomerase SurA